MNRVTVASTVLLGAALAAYSLVPVSLSAERGGGDSVPPRYAFSLDDSSRRAENPQARKARARQCEDEVRVSGLQGDDRRLFMIRCMSGRS